MKKILISLTLSVGLMLSACNNPGESDESIDAHGEVNNLLKAVEFNDGGWINFEGDVSSSENEMIHTDAVSYNPNNDYLINTSVYVSYYNDGDFIETILHNEEPPISIERVEDANNIKLSFSSKKIQSIELWQK